MYLHLGMGFLVRRRERGLAVCVFYRPCMVDTMEKRRGQAVFGKRRRLYVLHSPAFRVEMMKPRRVGQKWLFGFYG